MRIAFLCKRHYTGHDVILDKYGRLYEIPKQLADLGHSVEIFCLDYYQEEALEEQQHFKDDGLTWHVNSLGKYKQRGLIYPLNLLQTLRKNKPDLIIGASDIPHLGLAALLGKALDTPYVVDLYDNFESFGQAKIPLFKSVLKYSVRHAAGIIAVSEPLKHFVIENYQLNNPIHVMGNGIDTEQFSINISKDAARKELGLPIDAILIGTAGGLSKMKGVDILLDSFQELLKIDSNIHLVLAGQPDSSLNIPSHSKIHFLNKIPYRNIPTLFSALDIGVVTLADNNFGRYCFPQKAYEMLSCKLPIVATNLGVMAELMSELPNALYTPNSTDSFISATKWQLENRKTLNCQPQNWKELVNDLNYFLYKVL